MKPSQSSSTPSQVASLSAGAPAVQLSWTEPPTQEVAPVDAQAPVPQEVGCETKSSSVKPSQSSSMPSQTVSATAGS